jgi:hypothetical protein
VVRANEQRAQTAPAGEHARRREGGTNVHDFRFACTTILEAAGREPRPALRDEVSRREARRTDNRGYRPSGLSPASTSQ